MVREPSRQYAAHHQQQAVAIGCTAVTGLALRSRTVFHSRVLPLCVFRSSKSASLVLTSPSCPSARVGKGMLLATLAFAFVGCAAQKPPPARTPDETTLASGGVTTHDAEADAIVEDPSPPEPGQPPIEPSSITEPVEPEAPADEDAPRELLYRVQPDGLLINYDGLKMRPRAQAQRLSNGGYGITLTVTLEPSDETDKEVLLSDGSPLSVYAKIYDKAGRQKGSLPDVMGAAETQSVCAECDAQPWEATWPAAGATPLWWGERVVLEVGLWGIGDDSKDRRPMKRLFVVEYKAGGRTDPIVRPPEF